MARKFSSMDQLTIQEPHGNKKIWRYMDFTKFMDLVTSQHLFFCNLSKLTDLYEGRIPTLAIARERKRLSNKDHVSQKEIDSFILQEERRVDEFRDYTLVNCWNQDTQESYALWKIYLDGSRNGVAIRCTVSHLKSSIIDDDEFIVREVYYSHDLLGSINQNNVIFRKGPYYAYENEVRIALKNQFDATSFEEERDSGRKFFARYTNGMRVKVDTYQLIQEIYISPFCAAWFPSTLTETLKRVSPDLARRIKRSQIQDQ
ncbi:MAG: hypothetical protein WEC59_05675 [Salibacteraceae bacterium]